MLFRNTGKSFLNVSAQSGPVFAKPLSARGMAMEISTMTVELMSSLQ